MADPKGMILPDPTTPACLADIAELQRLIGLAIAGQISHQEFHASVANWLSLCLILQSGRSGQAS